MSYGYAIRKQTYTPPQRPIGVAIIATIGMLTGIALALAALVNSWLYMQTDPSLTGLFVNLSAGLGGALFMIWLFWGLWDLMDWAWWTSLFLGVIATGACIYALLNAPMLALTLAQLLPFELEPVRVYTGLIGGAILATSVTLIVMVYLVAVREAFRIGTKHLLKPWER